MEEKEVKEIFDGQNYINQQINLFMSNDDNFNEIINHVKFLKDKYKNGKFRVANSYTLMQSIISLCTFHNFTIMQAAKELDSMLEQASNDYIKFENKN